MRLSFVINSAHYCNAVTQVIILVHPRILLLDWLRFSELSYEPFSNRYLQTVSSLKDSKLRRNPRAFYAGISPRAKRKLTNMKSCPLRNECAIRHAMHKTCSSKSKFCLQLMDGLSAMHTVLCTGTAYTAQQMASVRVHHFVFDLHRASHTTMTSCRLPTRAEVVQHECPWLSTAIYLFESKILYGTGIGKRENMRCKK